MLWLPKKLASVLQDASYTKAWAPQLSLQWPSGDFVDATLSLRSSPLVYLPGFQLYALPGSTAPCIAALPEHPQI
jgi:hypothetical protein